MPAKNSKGIAGKRDTIITIKYFTKFKKDTGIDIDYKTFKDIIVSSNEKITECVIEDTTGFKLPQNLGFLVINKYQNSDKSVDYFNSRKYNKTIYLHNLHSFQFKYSIKWIKRGHTNCRATECYKLINFRKFKRAVAASIKAGTQYHKWTNSDFWSPKKTKRILYKTN